MKKLLLMGAMAFALGLSAETLADSVSGKVVSVEGNQVTVQKKDGSQATMQVSQDTTYRKKKIAKHDKMKKGHHIKKGEAYYKPMMEEDDWVDIIYAPSTGDVLVIEDVIVYDD